MDIVEPFFEKPGEDLRLQSVVPDVCKSQPCVMGIDEAGRGPVLGPMVYAAGYFPMSKSKEMKKLGLADSKTLNEEKRDELYAELNSNQSDVYGFVATILSPVTISNSSFRRCKYNLNALSHDTAIEMVERAMVAGVQIEELYVDTVGPKEKYQEKLKKRFPMIKKIKVESKADALFPVVSAASICAKVIRDYVIKNWRFPEVKFHELKRGGLKFGSGYPGDPATKEFLRTYLDPLFGFPSLVRFSWQTVKTILDGKEAIEVEWEESDQEDVEETENQTTKSMQITQFFRSVETKRNGSAKAAKRPLHRFYQERSLTKVSRLDF